MTDLIEKYRDTYGDIFVSPASVRIDEEALEFDVLVKNYGATKGMLLDRDWTKFERFRNALVQLGYGYSCMELDSDVESFKDVLSDWGQQDA